MILHRPPHLFLALVLSAMGAIACRPAEPEQRYGFITRLGNDTISVESVTRRANTVVVDGVDRFPRVRRRHTEVELGEGSTIRHLAMDIHTPSEPANQRERRVTADVIDREFDRFPLHHGVVRLLSDNRADIQHDWLSGTGQATFDTAGRMLAYSGARSTYLVDVARLDSPPHIRPLADRWEALEAAKGGVSQLSPRDTVRANIGDVSITIDYSRPHASGRELLGNVIPYDRVWRTGANAATQFATSAPITLAGIKLGAGTYTLWTVPHQKGVDLIVNGQSGQWGTQYNPARDVAKAPMQSTALPTPVDQFTISVATKDARHGTLNLEWGSFRWTTPIDVQL